MQIRKKIESSCFRAIIWWNGDRWCHWHNGRKAAALSSYTVSRKHSESLY